MQKVRIKKSDLAHKLVCNREIHNKEYDEAVIRYREKAKDIINKAQDDLLNERPIDRMSLAALPIPTNHSEEYDIALQMLAMSVDDVIELEQDDFNKLVRDNWEFTRVFKATNSFYGVN